MTREETKQFCRECNNILYPKEDKQEKMLYLACKNCEHFEESVTPVVYSIQYKGGEMKMENNESVRDIANDPTLRRVKTKECTRCKGNLHAVFQMREGQNESALGMNYVCCRCFKIESSVRKE